MYGLPQSGPLANEIFEKRLKRRGHQQSKWVPKIWKHDLRPIRFTLLVDDFGVKYVGGKHALHLKQTLEENYKVTAEWDSTRYIGIKLDWDYRHRQVNFSLPGYTDKALKQFNHTKKKKPNHTQAHLSYMVPKNNMQHNHYQCRCLTKRERNLFNRSAEFSIYRRIRWQHTTMPNKCHLITIRAKTHYLLDYISTQ